MRKIKFRAWDVKNKKMYRPLVLRVVLGELTEFDKDFPYYPVRINRVEKFKEELKKDDFLMQFTGLWDKNENEIYEEDIAKYGIDDNNENVGVVKWNGHGFWIKSGDALFMPARENLEVIGNIYENPELLNNLEDKNE